ncbi:MAG TPA: hypothetical protein PKA82_13785 [Pyrinomonadaceae bacterium]|nr:hypothetical protein [Pyrinomonadaceae bacterium]
MTSLRLKDVASGYGEKALDETITSVIEFAVEIVLQIGGEVISSALNGIDF